MFVELSLDNGQIVIESFNLRKQSKHLLECAKRAVEMAIEQDEKTAMSWLEKETREAQISHICRDKKS